jgi:tRNA G18 (ribose-2'-O)-methylase SpoU
MGATQSCDARGDLARKSIVIGDRIENPGNVDCLRAAAEMFDWECELLDDSDHSIALRQLARSGVPILAIENTSDAEDLFRYRPPPGRLAIIVGNERKGISRSVLRLVDRVLRIPIASAHINTVNVAAAAAIAVFHLTRARDGRIGASGRSRGRPEVLLTGVGDAIELGSAVRSAACFGWPRLFIDDRHAAWFASDRVTRSLARGAARRGRNPIRVLPVREDAAFDEVCIVGARGRGEPLRRTDLARGPGQLVVISDDSDRFDEDSAPRLGRRVRRVCLETEPGPPRPFRLIASIALAEIARQVGAWRTVTSMARTPGCRPGRR